jgi:cell division protein ZapB
LCFDAPLLPVELQRVNHTASTNRARFYAANPTIEAAMPNQYQTDQIGQLTERVEQLLVRYEALQHTHALALEQISSLTQERDSLKSRLDTVRVRVNALIERLPESVETALSVGTAP